MSTSGTVTVGVLSFHNSKETKAILNAVEALGHDTAWFREGNTVVRLGDGRIGLDPDADVVANRLLLSRSECPAEDLGVARTLAAHRPMLNDPDAAARAAHKFAGATKLADAGVPVPDAALALSGKNVDAVREEFGAEAVFKTAVGTHGGGAWKVDDETPLSATVGARRAFLQEFVGRDGESARDLRVYVVGDRIVGAMFRRANEGDWRTNVALGGAVEDATHVITKRVRDIALRSARTLGLDYAGVDLVEGEDGWSVLEVNPTAGFRGLFRATGRSPAPYVAALAIERAGGDVDDDRVEDLSDAIDDSVPSCKPREERRPSTDRRTIGFTERVVVSGERDTETVVGKSDTGAKRTSIDLGLAADVGVGPITGVSRVKSGGDRTDKRRPVVDVVVGVDGSQHTVAASVEDREHMNYPVLLGRDILRHYHLDIGRRAADARETGRVEE
ncbi:MAG: RimK family alpha-L-glutamate ligase [Salinigranum sp.]